MAIFNQYGTLICDQDVAWKELLENWGNTPQRKKLLKLALSGFQTLKNIGVEKVYITGSFASSKPNPGDIDGVIVTSGNFDAETCPEDILELLEDCGMDFYFDTTPTELNGMPHIEFFRIGRNNEKPGLILLDVTSVP